MGNGDYVFKNDEFVGSGHRGMPKKAWAGGYRDIPPSTPQNHWVWKRPQRSRPTCDNAMHIKPCCGVLYLLGF